MLRSKSRISRSGSFGSVFSRTLSASKLCRGDALGSQIDAEALKTVDHKKPSKVSNLYENHLISTIMSMQQQIGELENELRRTKEKLSVTESEKSHVLDQLRGANQQSRKANTNIESVLSEKDESLQKMSRELREKERDVAMLLSKNSTRIQELEDELHREKNSQTKMVDSLMMLTKQLEATKIELEESKIEIASLRDKIGSSSNALSKHNGEGENVRSLMSELEAVKENLAKARGQEERALSEMESLKKELKSATDAEEKSSKAMEDLALALREVATEASQAKEKLNATQIELEHVTAESEQLKSIIRDNEERYQKLLHEALKESELHKNTAERLRVEAEESLLAWNGKEMGFVGCIKSAEEEKAIARHESDKLKESLVAAENMTRAAREETYKLRDILKQAINEANAAKATSGIAREENSQLKDCLSEKEEALYFLAKENEQLRISEAAARENIKQLKRLLSSVNTDQNGILNPSDSTDEESEENADANKKAFRFDLEELKFVNLPEDSREKALHEDPDKAEALKGSIFDTNAETPPKSEDSSAAKSASKNHRRGYSLAFTEDDEKLSSVDFDSLERAQDDSDIERNSQRKMRTMFRRVGDILMIRKSLNKKEMSIPE